MEKLVRKYCKKCREVTLHTKEKSTKGFERFLGAIVTIGMSELDNSTIYMCTECETETKQSLI